MNKSWKTTLGGALTALGLSIVAIDDEWRKMGLLVAAMGAFFTGLFGRDNDKTSEQVNAPKAEGNTEIFLKK